MPLKMYGQSKENTQPRIKNIIAIAAGKGGVGKSTVTINIGRALQQLGYTVGILDADIYGPSIRKMLPEDRLPIQQGTSISPADCKGIRMISMAYFRKEGEAAVVRAPIANGIISQFLKNVEWGNLDYLLIDFPPGTGDVQLTLSQQANLTGAVMVTTPQDVAIMDVKKAMHLFDQVQIPIIGIVENMSYYDNPHTKEKKYLLGQGGGLRLAKATGVPFLGEVPIDPILSNTGDSGQSIFSKEIQEAKNIAGQFINIAQQVDIHTKALQKLSQSSLKGFELVWKEMST